MLLILVRSQVVHLLVFQILVAWDTNLFPLQGRMQEVNGIEREG